MHENKRNIRSCPGCGQSLRIPENIGGVTMACPHCGTRMASSFKMGTINGKTASATVPGSAAPTVPSAGPELSTSCLAVQCMALDGAGRGKDP